MHWDPQQYGRYADERARPFLDLLARVGALTPRRVVDLGCGPGTLTTVLARRWPQAMIEGLDSAAEMIAAATPLSLPRLTFGLADVADWAPSPDTDVIISNATLQWVPGHEELLRRWSAGLPEGGWLALQVPGNVGAPSHVLMRELACSPRWAPLLDGVLRHADTVGTPTSYATLLHEAGLVVDAWETTYLHILTGPDAVLEWVRGTALRPVLAALSPADAAEFSADYAELLRAAYPPTAFGTPFGFRRIFAVGRKP